MNTPLLATEKFTPEIVQNVHWWTDQLLTFSTTKPQNYSFTAGQYARLGLVLDAERSEIVWRAYSMTSAPRDNFLEFYGLIVPNGLFTARLKTIRPGERILIEKQSYGFMTTDRFADGDDLWMFATGTGVGPFISILRDPVVWSQFRNLILVHSARHANEFCYQNVLSALCKTPPIGTPQASARLQVIHSTTRDTYSPPPSFLQGRITHLLENGTLEKQAGLAINAQATRLMMCGNPEMIEDMRRILHHRGLRPCRRATPGQFVTENYW